MSTVGSDTFTEGSDTALNSHTPDVGAGWTLEAANFNVIASTNDVSHVGTVTQRARKGDNLGVDVMDVTADCKTAVNANRIAGICGRMNTSDFTHQFEVTLERTSSTTKTLRLWKNNGGGAGRVEIGSGAVVLTLNDNTLITLKLSIRKGTQEVFAGGVSQITATEADSTFAGNQYAGIIMNGNTSLNVRVDTFLSDAVNMIPALMQLVSSGMIGLMNV